MKQIGVKKAIGAKSKTLVYQFLTESILITFFSFVAAIIIVNVLLPQFNLITEKSLTLLFNTETLILSLGIILVTGLLAGSYPAFYLSGLKPILILRKKIYKGASGKRVRQSLVVLQFVLSILFIVGVFVVNEQMEYTQTKNLGYNRDNIISFYRPQNDGDPQVFLSKIKNIPGVISASNMNQSILSGTDEQSGYNWRGESADEKILFKAPQIGYDMIETLGMEIVEGRSFSKERNDDQFKIILNETALKLMGLEDPIDEIIDKDVGNGREKRQIIGVIRDFNYGSIHHKVKPLILRFRPAGRNIVVKIREGMERPTIKEIDQTFQEFHPDHKLEYSFLDEDYQALYESENRVAVLSKYFGGLAIIISCLGLFGLVSFMAERRTKEIGIRKILGSSDWKIIKMLSGDFSKLIIWAIIIALPISFWIAQSWLNNFAYRIRLDWSIFLGAGLLSLLIAWLTIGVQTYKVARTNPVESLKVE